MNGSSTVPVGPSAPILTPDLLNSILAIGEPKRVTITPEMAGAILRDRNRHNRPLHEHTVDVYAKAMKEGQWLYLGGTASFYNDGSVADCQHRLAGCVKSGVPFDAIISPNFPPPGIHLIDGAGKKRTPSESLALERVEHSELVSGAVALILKFVEKIKSTPSKFEVVTYVGGHTAALKTSTDFALGLRAKYPNSDIISPKEILAAHYGALAAGCAKESIETFLDALMSNEEDGTIANQLAHELMTASQKAHTGPTVKQRWAAVVECYGHFVKGKPPRSIQALTAKARAKLDIPKWPVVEPAAALAVPPPVLAVAA